jgi:hypothetical protein
MITPNRIESYWNAPAVVVGRALTVFPKLKNRAKTDGELAAPVKPNP